MDCLYIVDPGVRANLVLTVLTWVDCLKNESDSARIVYNHRCLRGEGV